MQLWEKEEQKDMFGLSVFGEHLNHVKKTKGLSGVRNNELTKELVDDTFGVSLDSNNVDDKNYLLGRVYDEINGVLLRNSIKDKIQKNYSKYYTFQQFNKLADFIDGLRLAKISEKDSFNSFIGDTTREYLWKIIKQDITEFLSNDLKHRINNMEGGLMTTSYYFSIWKILASRFNTEYPTTAFIDKEIDKLSKETNTELKEIVGKFYNIYLKDYKDKFDKNYTSISPIETMELIVAMLLDFQSVWQGEFPKQQGCGGTGTGTGTGEDWNDRHGYQTFKNDKSKKGINTRIKNKLKELLEEDKGRKQKEQDSKFKTFDKKTKDHIVPIVTVKNKHLVPFKGSNTLSVMFEEIKSNMYSKVAKHGKVTSKAWKLQYGNTKIFKEKPKAEVKIRVIVDISGSMGSMEKGTRLHKAYDIATSIGNNFNDVEIYGCSFNINSNEDSEYYSQVSHLPKINRYNQHIVLGKMSVGMVYETGKYNNSHIDNYGGTPLCLGLQHLKYELQGDYTNSIAILITDGYPSAYAENYKNIDYSRCLCEEHSIELGHGLHNAGVRFGLVNISGVSNDRIAPSECSINISKYDNSTDDLNKLNKLFSWLLSRGI